MTASLSNYSPPTLCREHEHQRPASNANGRVARRFDRASMTREGSVRIMILALMQGISLSATLACASPPTGPTSEIGTRNQLVSSLRTKSLNVSISGETSPSANGYFSVASTDLRVENDLLKVFGSGTAREMDADARFFVSSEGQPNPRAGIGTDQ